MPSPDPTAKGLWQDPIFGYFETHGKMEFKPGQQYDLTDQQKKAVMQRYRIKELLKFEYMKKEFDPIARRYHPGVIMDPAVFRWYAVDMQHLEVFRMTPKTIFLGLVCTILPFVLYARLGSHAGPIYDKRCREGRYLWWDREYRALSSCGCGFGQAYQG